MDGVRKASFKVSCVLADSSLLRETNSLFFFLFFIPHSICHDWPSTYAYTFVLASLALPLPKSFRTVK